MSAELREVPEIDAVALSYFGREVVIATAPVVAPARPVTVTKPSAPMETPPLLLTLPRQV